MANIDEVRKIQRSIYLAIKKRALELEGTVSAELKNYRRAQERLGLRDFEAVPVDELFDRIDRSRITYLGDFHTFDQSSRTLERLLRHLLRTKGRPLALGMEMVHEKHQLVLDSYVQGLITEQEFLETINYRESWRFPWHHYRPFFELAKKRGLEILALNSHGTLKQRDQRASELIANFAASQPGTTLLVLFGELHIVADKLPKQVAKRVGNTVSQCIIHQNLDALYWRGAGGDDATLVKFGCDEFALQSSPPWVKYESMLYWYESLAEDAEFDMHNMLLEGSSQESGENFLFYCERISRSFNLDLQPDELEDFNLFDQERLDLMLDYLEDIANPSIRRWQQNLIRRGKAFKLHGKRYYYCPHFSVNRLAYLAGIHLQDHLRRKNGRATADDLLLSRSREKVFLGFFYSQLLAYLCAKVINPFRKCDLYQDFQEKVRQVKLDTKKRENLKIVLNLFEVKKSTQLRTLLKGKKIADVASIAKKMAHAFGDTLYHEFFTLRPEDFQKITRTIVLHAWSGQSFIKLVDEVFPEESYRDTKKRFF